MRIRAVVADDEEHARAGLAASLREFEWIDVVGMAANGPATLAAVNELRPDLLFLDVQMPGLPGTEVLRHLTHQPYVVFVTAHAQHAVTAFELGALDYLLKPFGAERVGELMTRIQYALGHPGSEGGFGRFQEVFGRSPLARLFVRRGDAILPVPVGSIVWFEARGDYVAAHGAHGEYLLAVALSHLEARLDPARFARLHRAHIANLDHVVAFRRQEGRLVAVLDTGRELAVSRTRAAGIRDVAL